MVTKKGHVRFNFHIKWELTLQLNFYLFFIIFIFNTSTKPFLLRRARQMTILSGGVKMLKLEIETVKSNYETILSSANNMFVHNIGYVEKRRRQRLTDFNSLKSRRGSHFSTDRRRESIKSFFMRNSASSASRRSEKGSSSPMRNIQGMVTPKEQLKRLIGAPDSPARRIMAKMSESLAEMLGCEQCRMFMVECNDDGEVVPSGRLWTVTQKEIIIVPHGKGIVGTCLQVRDVVISDEPASHINYFKTPNARYHSMLCLPIQNSKGQMIGVLQFINKRKEKALDVGSFEGYIRSPSTISKKGLAARTPVHIQTSVANARRGVRGILRDLMGKKNRSKANGAASGAAKRRTTQVDDYSDDAPISDLDSSGSISRMGSADSGRWSVRYPFLIKSSSAVSAADSDSFFADTDESTKNGGGGSGAAGRRPRINSNASSVSEASYDDDSIREVQRNVSIGHDNSLHHIGSIQGAESKEFSFHHSERVAYGRFDDSSISTSLTAVHQVSTLLHIFEVQDRATGRLAIEEQENLVSGILERMLPLHVVKELKKGKGEQIIDDHPFAFALFSDVVGFTDMSAIVGHKILIRLINDMFTLFDDICARHKCYKVETIGDAYFVASGLSFYENEELDACSAILSMAVEMLEAVKSLEVPGYPDMKIQIRIGINAGPITAGIVGSDKIHYTLVGDTINTASRMESNSLPGKIQISKSVFTALASSRGRGDIFEGRGEEREEEKEEGGGDDGGEERNSEDFNFTLPNSTKISIQKRGEIDVKGKGSMSTFFVSGKPARTREYRLTYGVSTP